MVRFILDRCTSFVGALLVMPISLPHMPAVQSGTSGPAPSWHPIKFNVVQLLWFCTEFAFIVSFSCQVKVWNPANYARLPITATFNYLLNLMVRLLFIWLVGVFKQTTPSTFLLQNITMPLKTRPQ